MCIIVLEIEKKGSKSKQDFCPPLSASCEVFVWNDSISFRLFSLFCGEQSQGYYAMIGPDSDCAALLESSMS